MQKCLKCGDVLNEGMKRKNARIFTQNYEGKMPKKRKSFFLMPK